MKNTLTKFLNLDDEMYVLFQHGIQIILFDTIGFLGVIVQSSYFQNIIIGFTYIAVFSQLRVHSGGYHSKTKLGCLISYNLLYFLFCLLINSFIFNKYLNILLTILCSYYIIRHAPVEHIFAPLNPINKYRNKDIVLYSLCFFLILYIIFIGFNINLYKPISISIIYTSLLMGLLKKSKYYRG